MPSRTAAVLGALLLSTACGGAFSSRVDDAARAADARLGVQQLAEVIAQNGQLPLRRDVAEGVALLWVDYMLFADRLYAGDSLTDSATVVAATWPDVQQLIASAYHARLFGDSLGLDSAAVDSAYQAGEYRLIQHVLFRATDTTAADVRRAKRAQADYVLGQLRRDEVTWSEAAAVSDEPGGPERDGSLGVIGRGETVEPFENTAYGLAPGELSGITETSFGYHIVYRPPLADVRDQFREGIESRREQSVDSVYLGELADRWDVEVRSGAVPAVREMALDPLRAKRSGKVIGTYRGGSFRIRDLARWLQGMDPRVRQGLSMGTEQQIENMVRTLIRNEVLIREAREQGITLTPDDLGHLRDQLQRRIALVRSALGLRNDTLTALHALPPEQARARLEAKVLDYLHAVSRENSVLRTVPPFLADELREREDWDLVPAGIERALGRAREIRTQIDSVRATQGPVSPARPERPRPERIAPGTP